MSEVLVGVVALALVVATCLLGLGTRWLTKWLKSKVSFLQTHENSIKIDAISNRLARAAKVGVRLAWQTYVREAKDKNDNNKLDEEEKKAAFDIAAKATVDNLGKEAWEAVKDMFRDPDELVRANVEAAVKDLNTEIAEGAAYIAETMAASKKD